MEFNQEQIKLIALGTIALTEGIEESVMTLGNDLEDGDCCTKQSVKLALDGLDVLDNVYDIRRQVYAELEDKLAKEDLLKENNENQDVLNELRELFTQLVPLESEKVTNPN